MQRGVTEYGTCGVGESCSLGQLLFTRLQSCSRVKSPCFLGFPEGREIKILLLSFSLSHECPLCVAEQLLSQMALAH